MSASRTKLAGTPEVPEFTSVVLGQASDSDAYGQLTSADNLSGTAEDRSYAYDAAGNMTRNSGLCAANPNMVYPSGGMAGATSFHKHAPNTICGSTVSYDATGNTTAYDLDGAGPKPSRSFVYDGENRVSVR